MRNTATNWASALMAMIAVCSFTAPAQAQRIETTVAACIGAASALTDDTVLGLLRAYQRQVGDQQGGVCRWTGQVGDPKSTAALAEAARKELIDLSAGCSATPNDGFCVGAATLMARIDDMLNAVRTGSDIPNVDDLTFFDLNGIFGRGPTAIDLMKLTFEPDFSLSGLTRDDSDISFVQAHLNADTRRCANCLQRLKRVLPLIPLFYVMETSLGPSQAAIWREIAADARRNTARWRAYHFGGGSARTPLPQELWINGLIYQAWVKKQDRQGPVSETPVGPPNFALTFLHPSVGMIPYDSKGAKSNIVGVVEGLGLSVWSYDDVSGERKGEWGASFVGVYQPREDLDDWSPGALIRLPFEGISVLYSRPELANGRHDEVWAFSVDISKFGMTSLGSDISCMFGLPMCKSS